MTHPVGLAHAGPTTSPQIALQTRYIDSQEALMQYHHTAKVRRRRTVVGIVLWLAAFTIAMSTPLFSGGLLLAVLLLLLGLATILEANHAS